MLAGAMAVPAGKAICAAAILVRARAGAGPGRMSRSVRAAGVSGADGGAGGTAPPSLLCVFDPSAAGDQAIDHEHIEGEDRKRQA